VRPPNFFIVGAAKSGTSSLCRYLDQHPRIYRPDPKEPNFFTEYPPEHPRVPDFSDYLAIYANARPDQLTYDGSVGYLCSPSAASAIRKMRPDARIVMILRNPVDRAYSLYWHHRRDFQEPLSFEEALDAENERISQDWPFGYHYVQSGFYHDQVDRYLREFGAERVRIKLFEDFVRDPQEMCTELFRFLEIEEGISIDTEKVYNRTGPHRFSSLGRVLTGDFPGRRYVRAIMPEFGRRMKEALIRKNVGEKPRMRAETRIQLIERYEQDVHRLQELIQRDLSGWLRR